MLTLRLGKALLLIWTLAAASGALAGPKAAGKKTKDGGKAKAVSGGMVWRGPYGMAGCGWGGFAVGNNPAPLAQLGATILNLVSTNQSSALSSGTSNCDKAPPDLALMEQEVFVTSNLASLTRESAQGDGQHLAAFAELLGCSADYEAFAQLCQARHGDIFPSATGSEVLRRLKDQLSRAPEISCNRV